MTEIEQLFYDRCLELYEQFCEERYLTGYGNMPEDFIPPTEEERRRMMIDYANDRTLYGAPRGGW
jgi:hypothetical protein